MKQQIGVKEIEQKDDRTLHILWSDNRSNLFDVVELRRKCPCAVCVDEWSSHRKLKPEDVAESVRPVRLDSVGRYAITIQFSDSHKTGIYTYQYLRSLSSISG